MNQQRKHQNISKFLEKNYGGKWNYDGFSGWWCDDKKRFVFRKKSLTSNHLPIYKMYGQEKCIIKIEVK